MKKEYPRYKTGELQEVFDKFPKTEKEIINRFVSKVAINAAEHKCGDVKRTLIQFRHITEKAFDNLDLKTLESYMTLLNKSDRTAYTKNGVKTYLRRFIKSKYKNWSERFEELDCIRLASNPFNEEKINHSVLLTGEEIEKILLKEESLFWKTYFICLYESGMRPSELRKMQWKDIKFNVDNEISELQIFATKNNKSKTVYVEKGTHYLKKLKKESDAEADYVFPSPYKERSNEPINKSTVSVWFNRLTEKAIGRKVFPYILRHTRAKELYLNPLIDDTIVQKFLGHSASMKKFYVALSRQDVKDAATQIIYKTEDLPPEKKHKLEKLIEELKKKVDEMGEVNKVMDKGKEIALMENEKNKASIQSLKQELLDINKENERTQLAFKDIKKTFNNIEAKIKLTK